MHHRKWTLFNNDGLAIRVVWFDTWLDLEGPRVFRTDLEADTYIQLVYLGERA